MIGQIVNYRYEVLEKIGDGELFSVYRARDKVLNRLVALKVLSKDLVADLEFASDVARGYQDVAGLAHTAIARVIDADCGPDDCVVACEYARGISVKERVHRAGAIAVPLALDIIIPVLEALEYAHANRVIHGDIRPQDIVVSPDGEVKLTDFGLISALVKHPSVAQRYQMRSIHYQAPEVVEGNLPTIASDVYSVGVVLYEMLTSTLPFSGSSAVAVALKKVKETPSPPRSVNAAIPKTLNDIVMKAIETAPGDRYNSASAMLADLRSLRDALRVGQPMRAAQPEFVEREEMPPAAEPEGDSLKRRFWLLLTLFVLAVLVSLGATMLVVGQKKEIMVPPLLGKTWDEAQYEASQRGLELIDDGQVYSETYGAGKICSVIPPAGSYVSKDRPEVRVKISRGPSMVMLPDLTGMSEAEANEAAVKAGFMIGKVKEQYSDRAPVNTVISQDPVGGVKRTPGTAIDLVISLGPKGYEPQVPEQPNSGATTSQPERRFNVAVEVPADAEGSQRVSIVVNDSRGETIAYEQDHNPGDSFTTPVTTEGSKVRIRVYVGGELVSDSRY